MTELNPRIIIAGGGLAGCLAALALARFRPDIPFLLLEQGQSFGGNHVWSFFDTDVAEKDGQWIRPLVHSHWSQHDVRFPLRRKTLELGYNSIRSHDLDRVVREELRPERYRLGCEIQEVGADFVTASGERLEAGCVIDARGSVSAPGLTLGWQKFVGRVFRFRTPHAVTRPVIMDATVEQQDGYRFLYTLPFSDRELMLEDTYYSTAPDLAADKLMSGLDETASALGEVEEVSSEETGALPVVLEGELEHLWPGNAKPVARLGMRGGFFHPTTGYSLPDAVRNASLLTEQREFTSAALHSVFRTRAAKLWEERRFFQLLNRMLFRAAAPKERYRVLEHFYRLPTPVVSRFYAAQLTKLDKLRILTGRPPVPIGRALAAMRNEAA